MLQLRRVRECLGVCLQVWWLLLVPGTGSGNVRCSGEKLDEEAVVEVFSCWVMSAIAIAKISRSSVDVADNKDTTLGHTPWFPDFAPDPWSSSISLMERLRGPIESWCAFPSRSCTWMPTPLRSWTCKFMAWNSLMTADAMTSPWSVAWASITVLKGKKGTLEIGKRRLYMFW